MAEDLLDDVDGENTGNAPKEETSTEKKGRIKGLLGNKKKLIRLVLTLVLILGIGTGVWFFFFSGETEDDPEALAQAEVEAQEAAMVKEIVFEDIVALDPFDQIPLKQGSAMKTISLEISLELLDNQLRKQVYTVRDRLARIVKTQLQEKTWMALRSPEGKIRLKYELLDRMNRIFPKTTIRNIYFTKFLMQ